VGTGIEGGSVVWSLFNSPPNELGFSSNAMVSSTRASEVVQPLTKDNPYTPTPLRRLRFSQTECYWSK